MLDFLKHSLRASNQLEEAPLLDSSKGVLSELIKSGNEIPNRSVFRELLKSPELGFGLKNDSPEFRVLIELVDGHYVRTQYTELTFSNREITSPAGTSAPSDLGEAWANSAIQSAFKDINYMKSWNFINKIKSGLEEGEGINFESITQKFANFVRNPAHLIDLKKYHRELKHARYDQKNGELGSERFEELQKIANHCIKEINNQLKSEAIQFRFNVNKRKTGAGSLSLVYSGHESIAQLTGDEHSLDSMLEDLDQEEVGEGNSNNRGGQAA